MASVRSFVFFTCINIALILILNTGFGKIPPIGKILDPFNGFWQNAESSEKTKKNISIAGIDDKINIEFDSNMIPHISAKTDRDLHFAQGYITASDRLFQIDFQARVSAGRISEIIGKIALNFDRMQRRKGLSYGAINALASTKQDPEFYKLLEAYVAGINAYVSSLKYKNLPVEYKLLNYCPEYFTPLHIMHIAMLLADTTCGNSFAVENTADYFSLGKEVFELLFPDQLYEQHPIIRKGTYWNITSNKIKIPELIELVQPKSNTKKKIPEEPKSSGSNNWSINYLKTKTKKSTYLANDPHLDLSFPSIWYPMHLGSDQVDVCGVTIPGLPGVFIGFNKNIAWGITLTCMNVKGWYEIEFKDETKKEYLYEDMWLKSQFVIEEIKIKDEKTFYDTIIYTHLGPVIYDDSFPNEYGFNNIAMKWIGHNPGKELLGIYEMNRASCYSDFENGLLKFRIPIINVNYADKDSNIALIVAGIIPNKWYGQAKFVMPGRVAAYDWKTYIPQDHNPKVLNPKQGYVSSANQRATDEDYPYYYQHYSEEKFRNKRINEILESNHAINLTDMIKLQNDAFNQIAYDCIELIKSGIDKTKLNPTQLELYNCLINWKFYNDVEQVAPSIFREWQRKIEIILWNELYHCNHYPNFHRTIEILKDKNLYSKLNLGKYQSIEDIIHSAFIQTVDSLLKWQTENKKPYTWGNYRVLKINHLLRIDSFGLHELKVGGGKNIVNANEGTVGASMRLIVEFNDKGVNGFLSYPGGQSGNPGSPYYDNLIGAWESGNYIKMHVE